MSILHNRHTAGSSSKEPMDGFQPMIDRTHKVAVIGGGITGVSAAWRLHQMSNRKGMPVDIVLYEKEHRIGGKIRSEWEDGILFEAGPEGYFASEPTMREFVDALGLGSERVGLRQGAEHHPWVRIDGHLRRMPQGLHMGFPLGWRPLISSPLFTWRGKFRLAMEPFIPARQTETDETLATFARRRVGRQVAEHFVEPLLSQMYNLDADQLSLRATFPELAEMEQRHGSLWAAYRERKRRRHTRRSADFRGAGILKPVHSDVETIRSGMESVLVRSLEQSDRVQIETGKALERLDQVEAKGPFRLQFEDRSFAWADQVILATPAPMAATILRKLAPIAAAWLREIAYSSAVSLYLVYRRGAMRGRLKGTSYLSGARTYSPVKACTWVSKKWPHTVPQEKDLAILRCHMAAFEGRCPTEKSDAELIAEARQELYESIGLSAQPMMAKVYRWPTAMPQYTLGHVDRVTRIEQAIQRIEGLHVAGAAYGGIGVSDCVRQGWQAAEKAWDVAAKQARTRSTA